VFNPPNGIGAPPFGTPVASTGTGVNDPTGAASGHYKAHFRPDVVPPDLAIILRAFGTVDRTKVNSDYTFGDAANLYRDVRAGDDLKICHVATRNYSQASDVATAPQETCETRDPSTLVYARGPPTTTVNFTVFTDVAATLTDIDTGQPYVTPVET